MVKEKLGYQPTIYVDDGHGEDTAGKRTPDMGSGIIIKENQFNKPTAEKFTSLARSLGFRVVPVAEESSDVLLETRTSRANKDFNKQKQIYDNVPVEKLGIYISFHYNAYDGKFGTHSGGVEVHYYKNSKSGKELASQVLKYLVLGTPQINRGIKPSNFHVLRETSMVSVLIEAAFMDVLDEARLMLNEDFQMEVAKETLKGVCEYYGVPYVEEFQATTPIIGESTATVKQAQAWAQKHKAPKEFIDLASIYWRLAKSRGGVNPAIAYVQSAHETGFLYRDGISNAGIDASWKNPCGIKTKQGGGDSEASAHQRFSSWEEGITAHLDHLALYAGAPGYPRSDTPDPRHFPSIKGTATTVEKLSGKWAPSQNYGEKLKNFLKELESTSQLSSEDEEEVKLLKLEITNLKQTIMNLEEQIEKSNSERNLAVKQTEELEKVLKELELLRKLLKDFINIKE